MSYESSLHEKDGAFKADAKIAGGVDDLDNSHPLNCTTDGTLEVAIDSISAPIDVIVDNVVPVSQSGTWNVGVTNQPPFVFNTDGNLLVENISSKRLIWDTDTDWNKGTGTNTEVYGTGPSALLRPATQPLVPGDITYNVAGDYTLSSGTELQIVGGQATLKVGTSANKIWAFGTPTDYTYDSGISITGGNAQLTPIPVDPYAWYHLNESSGPSVADSSTHGRNGTTIGSPSFVAGKLNNAIELNGSTQYVTLGNIANFERTDTFSAEAWIYLNGSVTGGIVSRFYVPPPVGWSLYVVGNTLSVVIIHASGSDILVTDTASLSPFTWYHVVFTYNGSSTAAGVKIYVNSVQRILTIVHDTLTGSILNSARCLIGAEYDTGTLFKGKIDEVAIYTRTLNQIEINFRYNSGVGTELAISDYSISNPSLYPNVGVILLSAPTAFVETSTKPSGTEIKYQVSSDNGVTWKYWTGSAWSTSDLSYTQANLASVVNTNISSLASSGTFKFRALLNSDKFSTPLLNSVALTEPAYSTSDNLYVDTTNASHLIGVALINWVLPTFTDTILSNTDIKVLFSTDGRSTWFTWNGTSWVAPGSPTTRSTATTFANAIAHFSSLPVGSGTLDVRVFLYSSDPFVTPAIDNIHAAYSIGYYTTAHYETNIFDSGTLSQPWGVFDISDILPSGTAVIVKARASNILSNMGSYGSALTASIPVGINGQFVQFSIDFTGTLTARALVDYIAVHYMSPPVQDIAP